jgi:transposase-like protein
MPSLPRFESYHGSCHLVPVLRLPASDFSDSGHEFSGSRKPLVMWYRAMWYVTSQKNGASAMGLQRVLGLGSYETAWTWLHKLRRAMVRPDRDRLSGWVEVDETGVGGLEEGVAGRQTESKALVIIAAQADGLGIGRIRMRMIEDASAGSLHPFVQDCIEPGSTIHTDGWQGYAGLDSKGYQREITKLRGRRKEASELMPRVHRVASLLKRWLLGTTKAPWHISSSRTTWKNSRFASIAASPRAAASSSSVSCSSP